MFKYHFIAKNVLNGVKMQVFEVFFKRVFTKNVKLRKYEKNMFNM